ncbi:hypothetical protein [Nonomuraea typhae]|uniref:hypothetical protein n=1 Tax=Nonomuraea typhae TaxID=2603600 RepID=UPI0012FA4C34|nr:hypothetical protein [Nonomuraea typhae]
MNTAPVDQVEFRWQPGKDFSPIASSTDDRHILNACQILIKAATLPKGVTMSHRSLVYHVLPDYDIAAIIERSCDPSALLVGDHSRRESGGRHPQVARALIGTSEAVGVNLALACQWRGLRALRLLPPPGQVAPRQRLEKVPAGELEELVGEYLEHADGLSQPPEGLAYLIAGALREPRRPMAAVLPAASLQGPIQGSYLCGLRFTAGVLLSGIDNGWMPSFSTFEPSQSDDSPGRVPHLVFRAMEVRGGAPPMQPRDENKIFLTEEAGYVLSSPDDYDMIAHCLATAYHELGRVGLAKRLDPIVAGHPSLADRLNATLAELGAFLPASPALPSPAHAPPTTPSAQARHLRPDDDLTAAPPAMDDKLLVKLYNALPQEPCDDFFRAVEWICAAASRRVVVPEPDVRRIISQLNHHDWYVRQLSAHYRDQAPSRLAGLLQPVLTGKLRDPRTMSWLADRISQPDGIWTPAITLIYARLADPEDAAALAASLVPDLLDRIRATHRDPVAGNPPRSPLTFLSRFLRQRVTVPRWLLTGLATTVIVTVLILVRW